MKLSIELSPRAMRDLKALGKAVSSQILDDAEVLEKKPWPGPPKVKKLSSSKTLHRLRSGSFRIVFEKARQKVVVLRVLDRKDFEKILKSL